ncbi:MAG: flagellar basal body-associated FliL family protein, partial [Deltaproteobacteria bacterium]|nr:flagellar basal body-associated FliL family protein [Deltaproteobacteria bacterium]
AAHAAAAAPARPAPPGFTLALDPFVVMTIDAQHSFHAMRATIALEFGPAAREEDVRPYVARIRDATLSLLRSVTYEAASDPAQTDRLRAQLAARYQDTGVQGIARVLITDLVVQ